MTKLFCVHVFERKDYEDVEADSAEHAEEIVIKQNYPHAHEYDLDVEVMRECKCGLDNAPDEKKCGDCGEAL